MISLATSGLGGEGFLLQVSYFVVLYTWWKRIKAPHTSLTGGLQQSYPVDNSNNIISPGVSLCIEIHSIPHRTPSYESWLSKQLNANTVTLCGLLFVWLPYIQTENEWTAMTITSRGFMITDQQPLVFLIGISQTPNTLQSHVRAQVAVTEFKGMSTN